MDCVSLLSQHPSNLIPTQWFSKTPTGALHGVHMCCYLQSAVFGWLVVFHSKAARCFPGEHRLAKNRRNFCKQKAIFLLPLSQANTVVWQDEAHSLWWDSVLRPSTAALHRLQPKQISAEDVQEEKSIISTAYISPMNLPCVRMSLRG